jgi:hypothetical protein
MDVQAQFVGPSAVFHRHIAERSLNPDFPDAVESLDMAMYSLTL